MAVTTADEFLRVLEASSILTNAQFERALQVAGEEADLRQAARSLIRENLITTWQARQLLAGVTGLKLGKYRLLDELGRSELGRVYLAEHQQLGRRAALKLLSRELSSRAATLDQFLGDARAIAGLDHPHVVHTLDVAHEGERYYIVFEYVEGRNLAKLVEEVGAVPASQAVEFLRQAADGLSHAHSHGVFHGDLKPGNLIVDSHGNIKILDLGVARLSSSAHAQPDGPATSLAEDAFRAPELIRNPDAVTANSDIYSLGMSLFCLLTGQIPTVLDAEYGPQTTASLITQLSVLCPLLPDDLVAICNRLLAQDPADRFQSAAELRERLAEWLRLQELKAAEALHATAEPHAAKNGAAASASPAKSPRPTTPPKPASRPAPATSLSSSNIDIAGDAQAATDSIAAAAKKADSPADESPRPAETFALSTGAKRPVGRMPGQAIKPQRRIPWLWGAAVGGVLGLAAVLALVSSFVGGDKAPTQIALQQKGQLRKPQVSPELPQPAAIAVTANPTVLPAQNSPAKIPPTRPTPAPQVAPAVSATAAVPTEPTPKPAVEQVAAAAPLPAPSVVPSPPPVDPPPADPPAAPPPTKPFSEFAEQFVALPLPGPEGTTPVALGRLHLPKEGRLSVALLGGQIAVRGKAEFAVQAPEDRYSEQTWEVTLRDSGANSNQIAQLFVQNEQLWFQWAPSASANPVAPHLINCVLQVSTQGEQRQVALRKTVESESLKADVFKGPNRGRWDVPFAPDYDHVKVEVAFEGPFEPIKYDGAMPFDVEKGKTFAWFGANPDDHVWCYRVDSQLRKQLEVAFEAQMRTPLMGKLERLQPLRITQLYNRLVAERSRLLQRTDSVRTLANQSGQDGKQLMLQHEKTLEVLLHWSQRLQQVAEQGEQLSKVGRLHVRAYYEVEGKQYDLFRTIDFPTAAPTK